MFNRQKLLIILILVAASILRFHHLMHDAPYFFDPDERNMGNAITGLRLPSKFRDMPQCLFSQLDTRRYTLNTNCNLNPHFFAYGQFPLYLAFVSDQIAAQFNNSAVKQFNNNYLSTSFPSAIFWLRFWSALASTMTVLFVYSISKLLFHQSKFVILAPLLAAFTPGLIQSAHFGTTESLLTLFFMVSIYLSIRFLHQRPVHSLSKFLIYNSKFIILTSLTLGLALGTKLTGIFFFMPLLISIMIRFIVLFFNQKNIKKKLIIALPALSEIVVSYFCIVAFLIISSILFYFLFSPYNFIDFTDFKNSVFGYEQDVATGKYPAFYTRQFVGTTPLLFQAEKIFPYALGWPIFILGSMGILLISLKLVLNDLSSIHHRIMNYELRIKNQNGNIPASYFLLLTSFIIYLIPNAFLFAKWTRFMTPILPFFSIFAAYLTYYFRNYFKFVIWILIITSILPGLTYMSIYSHPDTRVLASEWIYKNIPNHSYILSETGNVADIPLSLSNLAMKQSNNYQVISFDFYHLDDNPLLFQQLLNHLAKSDYIFVPSRRIFANYMRLPGKYPLITKYYQLLFSGALGFDEIARISSYPELSIGQLPNNYQLSIPDESAEETWTVFDHPVVRIYKNTKHLSKDNYSDLFENFKIDKLKIE